jgi:YfiH family protein
MIYKNGVGRSTLLSGLPGIVHGYSDRSLGDGRIPANTDTFIKAVTGNTRPVVRGAQVHADSVAVVDASFPRTVPEVDAVVTADPSIMLEVHVADCVPVLLADPQARIIAAIHAGWKGTLAGIVTNAIGRMREQGATPEHTYASIGPHIGRCCYAIGSDRAELFRNKFGNDPRIVSESGDTRYLDIGFINRQQLLGAGVLDSHIDAPVLCTACQVDRFFSFRKDTKETFGEIIGVIGLTSYSL